MNDKVKHIIAGMVIGLITALLIRLFWTKDLMILGAGFAMLGGAAKELIWDEWFKKGTPEFDDAWATAWAGLTGSIICYFIL